MCLPPISVLQKVLAYPIFFLEAHENYQKRSYRNRFFLCDAQGPHLMSIPLQKGKNQQMSIKDITISYDTSWDRSFLRLLKSSYGSAPYFDYYYPSLERLIASKYRHLWDFNYDSLIFIMKALESTSQIRESESYTKEVNPEIVLDLRSKYAPQHPLNSTITYPQVFEDRLGFQSGLSIIDLLMNTGPEAALYF